MSLPPVTGQPTYDAVFWAAMAFAALVAVSGLVVKTPYGRFGTKGWGPALPSRLGWMLMEAPAPVAYLYFHLSGAHALESVRLLLLGVWVFHYTNRGVLFPLGIREREGSGMSLVVVGTGVVVTTVHGYLNGTWVGGLGPNLTPAWWGDPRLWIGLSLYFGGFALNVQSDAILRRLRDAGDGYRIPHGGGFRWVSCPNYLGELVLWVGYAVATGSPGGLFIFCVSAANLVPRALATHRWYREHFPDYPADRRALLPGVL